jgi:hypothetical protein
MTLRHISVEQARRLATQTDGSLLAAIEVDGDGTLCAITTWGQPRAERRGLRGWLARENDDGAGSMAAWAALEKP